MKHSLNAFKMHLEQKGLKPSRLFKFTELYACKFKREHYVAIIPCDKNNLKYRIAYKFASMKEPTIEISETSLREALNAVNQLFKV